MTDEPTESTRIHEAAHAVAAVELRIALNYVTVEPDAWSSGHAMYRKLSKGQENYMVLGGQWFGLNDLGLRRFVERHVIFTLAGRVAEQELLGAETREPPRLRDLRNPLEVSDAEFNQYIARVEEHGWPPLRDEESALEIASLISETKAEASALVAWLLEKTRSLCRNPFFAVGVRAVADELSRHPPDRSSAGPGDCQRCFDRGVPSTYTRRAPVIYQALEDVMFVDEQGVPRKVRAGGWIRTPGPDELALNGSPSSFARIDDLDPDILAAAEERVLSTTLNRMKVARYLLAGLLLLWIRKLAPNLLDWPSPLRTMLDWPRVLRRGGGIVT